MASLLSHSPHSKIYILAGLHTGKHVVQSFLSLCRGAGLVVQAERVWDRLSGVWLDEEDRENHNLEGEGTEESRRRWLMYVELERALGE